LVESLQRLRTDYVDVYQAHDIEFATREQIVNETLPAMHRLKEEGKARFIGITAYPLHLLKGIAETVPVDTVLTYCRYNLLDTSMNEVLAPLTRDKDIALINGSPLHMGALTEKGAPAWHPAPKRVLEMAQKAVRVCGRRGANISDIALQFALAHPHVSTTLVGMSKVRHVTRALDLLGVPVDEPLLNEVLDLIRPVVNICWQEGRPENFDPDARPQQS
jgi:L-galactose dehydrogenase